LLVFTSNLISQTTWLKVKLKLVNFLGWSLPARKYHFFLLVVRGVLDGRAMTVKALGKETKDIPVRHGNNKGLHRKTPDNANKARIEKNSQFF